MVDAVSVCFAGIDSLLVVRILDVEDVGIEDTGVVDSMDRVRPDFCGGVSFVVDVLRSWFGVT